MDYTQKANTSIVRVGKVLDAPYAYLLMEKIRYDLLAGNERVVLDISKVDKVTFFGIAELTFQLAKERLNSKVSYISIDENAGRLFKRFRWAQGAA